MLIELVPKVIEAFCISFTIDVWELKRSLRLEIGQELYRDGPTVSMSDKGIVGDLCKS